MKRKQFRNIEKVRIMDYKKIHEEALARAKSKIRNDKDHILYEDDILDIFPELKESEDEKIRKELIRLFRSNNTEQFGEFTNKQFITWLEKQKEFVSADFDDVWETEDCDELTAPLEKCSKDAIKKMCHAWYDKGIELERRNWLEKQGEQNPVEKVTPKFEVGDWIVDNCGYVWKIGGILNQFYLLEGVEGDESRPTIEWVNKTFHLWTIQDAKDGDVLVTKGDKRPFIFKGLLDSNHPNCPVAYCGISSENLFLVSTGIYWWNGKEVEPATKEQRDTLEKAMADAGYEWDDEKKELKKIVQMPAWSEEDEVGLGDALWAIEQARTIAKDENDMGNLWYAERWLKALKDRVQPQQKQEWCEEERARIDKIVDVLDWAEEKGYIRYSDWEDYICYVKSLKPQNTWKPSDEQMVTLYKYAEQNTLDGNILTSLHNELKKLRGE